MTPAEVQCIIERTLGYAWMVSVDVYQPHAEDGLWRVHLRRLWRHLPLTVDEATMRDEDALERLIAEREAA